MNQSLPKPNKEYIYNYKDGKNYLGEKGKNPEQITRWCVGGSNPEYAADYV